MRVVLAIAAGLMWASAAYAQASAPGGSPAEPSMSQAQSPTTAAAPATANATTAAPAVDANHEVICHTIMATGSRLSRHGTRVCKTREQWEAEMDQNNHDMMRSQQVNGGFQGSGPAPGGGSPN